MTSILGNALMEDGYSFLAAADLQRLLPEPALADWAGFRASWGQLGLDAHMADGGRYRRRRFAAFFVDSGGLRRKPHQPHFQSRDHNPLNGGVERWFEPIDDFIAGHSVTEAILKFGFALFDPLAPAGTRPDAWHAELHQFRIEPDAGASAPPTPEGIHRDGVDWV
ncbi:2OG-Fe dioxygenase family protein [Azospirillum sp. A26]|uniref:2OG-Fe dioxygenase family protein n=1 Tax=Azospirillum sp. A26 TaxID=3160607 RepID=UPI00366F22A6